MVSDSNHSEREDAPSEGDSACCKVGRTAAAFDLSDVFEELSALRRDGESFRSLAAYFNTEVVESTLREAGVGDARSIHAALMGDDIARDIYDVLRTDRDSDIRRAEVRARLSDTGIDVDALESAFVSHVTVRSHLQDCVGVTPDESPPPFEQTVNTAQGARTRANNVIQSTINRAVRHGHLQTGEIKAEVVVRLSCNDCGKSFYLSELLDQRRCNCTSQTNDR